jgi:hypothetical protein
MAGRNYTALGYCNEVDIENYLLLDINDIFSNQIEDWIATAETIVNDTIGITTASGILMEEIIGEKSKTRIDSDGNLKIFPRKIPIDELLSLQLVKGSDVITMTVNNNDGTKKYDIPSSADYISYPAFEYSISGASIVANLHELRPTEFYTKINYRAGYRAVPPDIRLATVCLVCDMVMRHANKEGLESITQGRVSKRYSGRYGNQSGQSDFWLDAMNLLNSYRISSLWF